MRFQLASISLAACFCAAAQPCTAQTAAPAPTPAARPFDAAMQSRIDSDVSSILQARHGTAATIAIVEDGKIVYAQGYGMRDLAASLPAGASTRYEIGSITKQFTAAAILQLRDAGKLSLDAPLATYLPGAPHAQEVTIRQLLTHTSGLHEYLEGPNVIAEAAKPVTFDALMSRVATMPLDFKPGTKYAYSNTNYIILGKVIETVSHQPYEAYIRAHVFAPAAMTQTTTIADEARVPEMARGYVYEKGKTEPAPPLADSWAWSAGNIVTTVADLQKWNAALSSGKVVSAADYALMIAPPLLGGGNASQYGFGLRVDEVRGAAADLAQRRHLRIRRDQSVFPNQATRILHFHQRRARPGCRRSP